MTKKNTKKAGFSLIELLFAMLFLSIIMFGVIKLQTSNLTLSNTKQLELKAYSYATQGLEIVSALGYTELFTVFTTDCPGPASCTCEVSKNINYEFSCTGSAEVIGAVEFERSFTLESDGLIDAYLVTTNVSWTDSSGDHSASAKRIISN